MKNFIKISCLPLILLCVFACNNNDDLKYNPKTGNGWIQFPDANPDVILVNTQAQPTFDLGVDIQVPEVAEDLVISYTLVSVAGLDPNSVFSNSGQIVSPAGESSYAGPTNNTSSEYTYLANITFDTSAVPLLSQEMVFDVVLTGTNSAGISVGLDGTDIPTTQRVRILCSNPEVLPSDFLVGTYMIEDVTGVIGPGNGTTNFAPGVVTITVDAFNPNVRLFNVAVVPAFNPAIQPVSLELTEDDRIVMGDIFSGIGCGPIQYIYTEAGEDNSFWDICSDDFVLVNYTEDANASCGGPWVSTFSLTKVE